VAARVALAAFQCEILRPEIAFCTFASAGRKFANANPAGAVAVAGAGVAGAGVPCAAAGHTAVSNARAKNGSLAE
jgi:hypothetical protein